MHAAVTTFIVPTRGRHLGDRHCKSKSYKNFQKQSYCSISLWKSSSKPESKLLSAAGAEELPGGTVTVTNCFLFGNALYLSFSVSFVFRTKYGQFDFQKYYKPRLLMGAGSLLGMMKMFQNQITVVMATQLCEYPDHH